MNNLEICRLPPILEKIQNEEDPDLNDAARYASKQVSAAFDSSSDRANSESTTTAEQIDRTTHARLDALDVLLGDKKPGIFSFNGLAPVDGELPAITAYASNQEHPKSSHYSEHNSMPVTYASGKPPASSSSSAKPKVKQPAQQQTSQSFEFNRDEYLQTGIFESALIGTGRGMYASGQLPSTSSHQANPKLKQSAPQPTPGSFEFNRDEYLQAGFFKTALINFGRSATEFGQGIKQLYLQSGAKFGWGSQAEASAYTRSIDAETALYDSTPVAKSVVGKTAKFAMDTAIYSCIPAGAGARGAKLIFSSAAAGGLIGGLQPVADGQWSTRLQNAGVGAVVGGVGAPIVGKVVDSSAAGILKLYDLRRARQTVISTSSPAEIAWGTGTLSTRQNALLEALPEVGSQLKLHKSDVNVTDLASLTAHTGHEFALFTLGSQRLVIRGNEISVNLKPKILQTLKEQGYKWSAHTHPSTTTERNILDASGGDRLVLQHFDQDRSLILDSLGRRNIFDQTDNLHPDVLTTSIRTSTTKLEIK